MLMTTTSSLDGRPVRQYLGVVNGEAIIGANLFKDMFASIRNVVGVTFIRCTLASMKMCDDIGTRCAAAIAAARCQPVTPPIFIASGMHRSTAPAASARCIEAGPHQFSPPCTGTARRRASSASPASSCTGSGSSSQRTSSASSARPRRSASGKVSAWL